MNINTQQATPQVVRLRLTLDVTYLFSGETVPQVFAGLQRMCERAVAEGLLIGETSAKVDAWSIDISELPSKAERDALAAKIAAFMRQRIKDGDLDAEGIPVRLARYGLMTPEAFADEMRERMEMAQADEASEIVCPASTTPADSDEIEMPVAIACVNASGMSDMPIFTVRITREEYDLGVHYDKAKDLAEEARYEGPFVCFDAAEQGAIRSAARELELVPQVVVIDMNDGLVHSVCCDAGHIKVVCYDTGDTDEHSDAVAERPVGENGQLVRCWAHTEVAQADPGLKQARD